MNREQMAEQMNDAQLKREIEEALSVDPSPNFASRVRARAAETSRLSAVWLRWGTAAAGVAIATLVIAVVIRQPKEPQPTAVKVVRTAAPAKEELPTIPQQPAPRKAPKAAEPEVLVNPREVAAFFKLVEGVQEHRIDASRLIEIQREVAKPPVIENIALMPLDSLEPVVIEPLTSGARRFEGGSL
jgi:hypothetical protein